MSHIRKLFSDFRRHPGMYTLGSYDEAAAFVLGADMATGGYTLRGFREWLVVRTEGGNNLAWAALVLDAAFPERRNPATWIAESSEANRIAIDIQFDLIDEFLEDKTRRGINAINEEYQSWIGSQS